MLAWSTRSATWAKGSGTCGSRSATVPESAYDITKYGVSSAVVVIQPHRREPADAEPGHPPQASEAGWEGHLGTF